MNHFDVLDFSECHSEEMMFLLMLSVYICYVPCTEISFVLFIIFILHVNFIPSLADPRGGGGATGMCPAKIGSTMFFLIQLFIRMLRNKAQIARESIKTTLELPGPLSGPWTPAESELGSALVMCVRAHNLLRPP